jgi:hypothetical protein
MLEWWNIGKMGFEVLVGCVGTKMFFYDKI